MRSWRELFVTASLAVACILGLASCKSPRRTEPIVGRLSYPDSGVLGHGRKAFDRHCHSCHPDGAGGLGPSLNDKPLPGTLIEFQVRHGLGVMPAFDHHHLSDEDLEAIVAYLKDLRTRRSPGP